MFNSIKYETSGDGAVAFIVLNRPNAYNAIDVGMPKEIRAALKEANADEKVRCIVVKGNGPGFCGGYDLQLSAEQAIRGRTTTSQDVSQGYDPYHDYALMKECTDCYSDLFHSYKPTIAQIHGAAVAGGSDIALCCDLVVMAEDARIGYPPSRVWGCPTTAMWAYRIGVEKAKRMLFTGDLISGAEAERLGLVLKAVPRIELEYAVVLLTDRIKTVPVNQLWMQKQVLNGTIEAGIAASQKLATVFDGITRNSPEGIAFQRLARNEGFKHAVVTRDTPGRTEAYRSVWRSSL